jgi:hypothetical protein
VTARRRIKTGAKVPVAFTARERALVIDHTFAGPELTEPLEAARVIRGKYTVRFTLDDIDELLGHVAAEANHSKNKRLQRELDALYERLQTEMESYDDGGWQQPAGKAGDEAQPVKPSATGLSVIKGGKES